MKWSWSKIGLESGHFRWDLVKLFIGILEIFGAKPMRGQVKEKVPRSKCMKVGDLSLRRQKSTFLLMFAIRLLRVLVV